MSYVRMSDLGALTVEQLSASRKLSAARFGVTTGCFTTRGESLQVAYNDKGDPSDESESAVLQAISSSAAESPQRNLTQEEVSFILAQRTRADRLLGDMLEQAAKSKEAWADALAKVNAWADCNVFCSGEKAAYNESYANADASLRVLGSQRYEAFRTVDVLMVFAQNQNDAQKLCSAKIRAYGKLVKILNEIAPTVKQITTVEERARSAWAAAVNGLLAALQAFMALLSALIETIKGVFQGLAAAAGFFAGSIAPFIAENPKVVLYGALGTVALGAGLFGFIKYRQAKLALVGHI